MLFSEKIFSLEQVRAADAYTLQEKGISSWELMEKAATACIEWIGSNIGFNNKFAVVCGLGNNGGDGLAIARLLSKVSEIENVVVYITHSSRKQSRDFQLNYEYLQNNPKVKIHSIAESSVFHIEQGFDFLIDAVIGSGLSAPVSGWLKTIIESINALQIPVISIDIPSGLSADFPPTIETTAVKATYTLSFQFPKRSFMFKETEAFVGDFSVLPIGLSEHYIQETPTEYYYITESLISNIFKKRQKFSHKGTYGHALIIAGSYGKMGASVLASKACLRSGAGLLTSHVPVKGIEVLQTAFPEAMLSIDVSKSTFSSLPSNLLEYDAVGVGPGIGKAEVTQRIFKKLIVKYQKPMVIDADALNIISENNNLIKMLPKSSILTPHVKEFERLTSISSSSFERLQLARSFAIENKVIIVLKGAHTAICSSSGEVYFNSTGNQGMATAGSGDVLTGILTAFLAQGYEPLKAAIAGVFFHGKAGNKAALKKGQTALIASDIISALYFDD